MRIFIILFLLAITFNAKALDLAQKTIGKGRVLRGEFNEEKTLQGFASPLKSNGHFAIVPGSGLIWATDKPFAVTTIIKPSGLTQKINGNQTMDMPAEKIPFMTRLYSMLSGTLAGDWSALEADFTVSKSGTDKKWQVILEPRQKDNISMPFSLITVTGSEFVEHVEMKKSDGDSDNITFSKQKLSAANLSADETAELK